MANLIDEYEKMHGKAKRFPGYSLSAYVKPIAALIEAHRPSRLLDYGCGKGYQYLARRCHEAWGGLLPHCYDPAVQQLATVPQGLFGGVICSDVLEHVEREDLAELIDELLAYVEPGGFLFLAISCRPTRKRLSDGRDVHVTIEPPSWWQRLLAERADLTVHPVHLVAHFDVAGHFSEPETPWEIVP